MNHYKLQPLVFTFICLSFSSCDSTKKATADIPKPKPILADKHWTLESTPNGIDVVGHVFAIDSVGERVRLGTVNLQTVSSPVAVTQQTYTKNLSIAAVASFLAIKNIDSTSNIGFQDTSHLNASFTLNNGIMTVINDDIGKAFEQKSQEMAKNIKFLKLENAKVFLILETIKSPSVSITFDKSKQVGVNLAGKLKSLIGIGGHVMKDVTNNSDLIYTSPEPITVFYNLRAIDINVIGSRGTEEEKVDLTLGRTVKTDELVYKTKGE